MSGPELQTCFSQLRSNSDDERLVGLLMLTKILPSGSLSEPSNTKLRHEVFDAIGVEFLKRLLQTKDGDNLSRGLALSIISSFTGDMVLARKFRSAVPVLLKTMRTSEDASQVQDAVAAFAGVVQSGADVSAASYLKVIVSLCKAAALLAKQPRTGDEWSKPVVATLQLAISMVSEWERHISSGSPQKPGEAKSDLKAEDGAVLSLQSLCTDSELTVATAACDTLARIVTSEVARVELLQSYPSETGSASTPSVLRQLVKSLLAVYGSQHLVDAGFALASNCVSAFPEEWSSEPQFALLTVRQAGVEVKLVLDELEAHIGGVVSGSEGVSSTIPDVARFSRMFAHAATLFEGAVKYLVAFSEEDEADMSVDATLSPSTTQPPKPLSPERLAELLFQGKSPIASQEEQKAKAESAKSAMHNKLTTTARRWLEFPGDVLLMLRGTLEDVVRVCCGFVSVIAHCDVLATILSSSTVAVSSGTNTALQSVADMMHPFLLSCIRMVGKFLAEDTESFQEELLDMLPFVSILRPLPDATTTIPECFRMPLCSVIPALVMRSTEVEFVRRFCDVQGHAVLMYWSCAASRSLMVLTMELQRIVQCGESIPTSVMDTMHSMIPLLSMCATTLFQCHVLLPSLCSACLTLDRAKPSSTFVRSVCVACEHLLKPVDRIGSNVLSLFPTVIRSQLQDTIVCWMSVAVSLIVSTPTLSAFTELCTASGSSDCVAVAKRCVNAVVSSGLVDISSVNMDDSDMIELDASIELARQLSTLPSGHNWLMQ